MKAIPSIIERAEEERAELAKSIDLLSMAPDLQGLKVDDCAETTHPTRVADVYVIREWTGGTREQPKWRSNRLALS